MVNPPYALTHCCMVTEGVLVLGDFYMDLLGTEDSAGERCEELDLDGGILAVYASDISKGMAPGAFV